MEYRPNSKPEENSIALNTESFPLPLSEHYILTRAVNVWDGPKFVTYRTNDARLKSFVIHEWPLEWHPKPSALSDAGFFYTGKTYMLFWIRQNVSYTFRSLNIPIMLYRFEWSDVMFPLRRRAERLVTNRRPVERTCSMVSFMRLCQIYHGHN